jgi:hypothetical protein
MPKVLNKHRRPLPDFSVATSKTLASKGMQEMGRRVAKQLAIAARRQLGCDLDTVPRRLMGRDIADMDREAVWDWFMLTQHLNLLFNAELRMEDFVRLRDDPDEREEADA